MKKSEAKIGRRVRIIPEHTNKDLLSPKEKLVYIRENHSQTCAGVSYRKNGKHCYGVLYEVLHAVK